MESNSPSLQQTQGGSTITYGDEVPPWVTGFVNFGAANDNFGFDVAVHFESERPEVAWWFEDLPEAEFVDPRPDQALVIDDSGSVRVRHAPPTRRGMSYGVAWEWEELDWA